MKFFLFLISYFLLLIHYSFGQAGEWTWMRGSNTYNSLGNYGVQGVPSPTNDPQALYEPCEWTDTSGNFWLYGGLDDYNGDEVHNDLWKYDPTANEWTWISGTASINDSGNFGVQGIASPTNRPPSLGWGASSWVDLNGNLWVFGGSFDGYSSGDQSNLWKYDIGANEWTWVNGPGINVDSGIYGIQGVPDTANYPPARSECAATWTDNAGDLWLFGGVGVGNNNVLWRYNIASNSWTWMKGSNVTSKGWWGVKGIEDPANTPSGRYAYTRWKDKCGNFWLFGGFGNDAQNEGGALNDLWRFNIATNNWTWMNGPNIVRNTNNGVYGTKCVTSPANVPPPRYECRTSWTDISGNFWMFGGIYDTTSNPFSGTTFMLNDLWKYCVSANEWTWESGDSTSAVNNAVLGTMGVASPSNKPTGLFGAVGWNYNNGSLYLFGGAALAVGTVYNDVWRFAIDSTCAVCAALPPCAGSPVASFQSSQTTICANDCINFTDLSSNDPTSWQWSFQGGMPSTSSVENPQNICYPMQGNYNVLLFASNGTGSNSVTYSQYITVYPSPPTPVITQHQGHDTLFCSTDPTYTSYQWSFDSAAIAGANDTILIFTKSGNYNVEVTNENGCKIAVGINVIIGIQSYSSDNIISLYPNPAANELSITGNWQLQIGKVKLSIFNTLGQTIYTEELNRKQETINCKPFPAGIYFIQITSEKEQWVGKFVKE